MVRLVRDHANTSCAGPGAIGVLAYGECPASFISFAVATTKVVRRYSSVPSNSRASVGILYAETS
jgi:hypothetical protein